MSNMVIRTNVLSLNSHRNLGLTGTAQARASARLSSGFRINSAADDAAGLGISEKMRGQIRGLDQASRNGQDGISLIQTAEGAMATINEMVIRIRELVVQAANDTNVHTEGGSEQEAAQSDRLRIQDEINQLLDEIDATRDRVEFNTRTLLDGSIGGGAVASSASAASVEGVDSVTITASWNATESVASVQSIQSTYQIFTFTNPIGDTFTHQEDTASVQSVQSSAATTASQSFLVVSSVASSASRASSAAIPGNPPLWFHVGANSNQGVNLVIEDIGVNNMSALGREAVAAELADAIADSDNLTDALQANEFYFGSLRATGEGNARTGGVLRESGEEINLFLVGIDMALAHVNEQRSNLGAMQNRLEYTIENLDIASENLQAANSRIRDADMASEMMRLTQMNVLQQAATAMLAQANQAPQMVLQLLG